MTTISASQNALAVLDSVVGTVGGLRAIFGTVQNRLESTLRSRAVAIENTSAAVGLRPLSSPRTSAAAIAQRGSPLAEDEPLR